MHHWVLEDSRFDSFGTARMVRDLLHLPGQLEFTQGQLQKVALLKSHPYAEPMCSMGISITLWAPDVQINRQRCH